MKKKEYLFREKAIDTSLTFILSLKKLTKQRKISRKIDSSCSLCLNVLFPFVE